MWAPLLISRSKAILIGENVKCEMNFFLHSKLSGTTFFVIVYYSLNEHGILLMFFFVQCLQKI